MDVHSLHSVACRAIDEWAAKLQEASHAIWMHPELKFEERFAHDTLTKFLEEAGFEVDRHFALETAFQGRTGKAGTKLAVLCEYDALPGIGHACGHNLIAEAGLAAAIGVKAVLQSAEKPIDGQLVVLGTPAEEGGGGKITMLEKGCFDGVSAALMVHPCPSDLPDANVLAVNRFTVTFRGKASHAAAFPWEGINALDAAVAAYTNVSMLRQQMKPTWRVHCIISNGGAKPNIIPEVAAMEFYVRAPTEEELKVLQGKVTAVVHAAADATGCTAEVNCETLCYSNMASNSRLLELYVKNATDLGVVFQKPEHLPCLSTDMGNVSYVVPSIHPMYSIGSDALNHTRDFTKFSDTDYAHKQTLIFAKAMAMTAIDIFTCPGLMDEIKSAFEKQLKEAKAEK
eukprot:m.152983 g.152983  ORF g.152983 m.152983 type:complete len:399 (+) comp38610_c0_seq2:31-1227(+)